MSEAQKILKMIETVSKDDTAKLDEIDARAQCYAAGWEFIEITPRGLKHYDPKRGEETTLINPSFGPERGLTRSRDQLKAIRPEGKITWMFCGNYPEGAKARAEIFHDRGDNPIQTDWLPTEELAELHAIIQAIEYERDKS